MTREILCLGDSNTHGFQAGNGSRYDAHTRWTGVLAELLGPSFHVIEEGLNGRTTVFKDPVREGMSALSVLAPVMLTHEPLDTMIVMLGTNDTKERFGANAQVIALGMERLLQKALTIPAWRGKPDILLIAPAPLLPDYERRGFGLTMGSGCYEKSAALPKLYRALAHRLGLRYLDAGPLAELHPFDGIHLTRAGHRALAEALAELFRAEQKMEDAQ